MSEYTPAGSTPRMTKAQMRKYLADLKRAQDEAKKKLDPEKEEKERHREVTKLEKKFDDVF